MNITNIEDYPLDIPINAELRSYQKEGINWLAFLSRYGLHGVKIYGFNRLKSYLGVNFNKKNLNSFFFNCKLAL